MRLLAAALAALTLAALALTACGNADELSKADTVQLDNSRSDLDDALDTAETLRTSKEEARKLHQRVRKIIADGSLENDGGKPDEFGLAALGRLREIAPSLVVEEPNGSVRSLDQAETKAFLAYAVSDPAKALYPAAKREVDNITKVLGDADNVGADTKLAAVPGAAKDQTVDQYLREAARDTRALWPALSKRLADARDDLS